MAIDKEFIIKDFVTTSYLFNNRNDFAFDIINKSNKYFFDYPNKPLNKHTKFIYDLVISIIDYYDLTTQYLISDGLKFVRNISVTIGKLDQSYNNSIKTRLEKLDSHFYEKLLILVDNPFYFTNNGYESITDKELNDSIKFGYPFFMVLSKYDLIVNTFKFIVNTFVFEKDFIYPIFSFLPEDNLISDLIKEFN